MTECNQSQFQFEVHFSRRGVAEFSGARLTSDGGALLLRAADRKIGLLRRVVGCFSDARDPQRIAHALSEVLSATDPMGNKTVNPPFAKTAKGRPPTEKTRGSSAIAPNGSKN